MENKPFNGKAIYNPQGKAAEYSKWAVNFYNGCSARCEYCYNRHGITAKVLGADKPTLKKSLGIEGLALQIFMSELDKNIDELRRHGLFFNFVSDPCLPETYELNKEAMHYCLINEVPVKILTKQAWWIEDLLEDSLDSKIWGLYNVRHLFAIGFTLTGHDELEPGAATNADRIRAMKVLNDEGFKTWASIEPIIDIESSKKMIGKICDHVDLVKIGLQSGKKSDQDQLLKLAFYAKGLADICEFKIYLKDSFVNQAGIYRASLPDSFVTRDYNIFE